MLYSVVDPRRIMIIGFPGRLASAFSHYWRDAMAVSHKDLDITDYNAVLSMLTDLKPKIVVNCAALTNMQICEHNPSLAWSVNVEGVRYLASVCHNIGTFLVHFSSDYALAPVNEYARTKRASEAFADLTIRAKLYDHTHWAWKALCDHRPIQMLTTEFLNPISTSSLVRIIERLLVLNVRGIVSVGTKERLSFWQVGCIWAQALNADVNLVEPIDHLTSPWPRLNEMFLDTKQLIEMNITVPTLMEDAAKHVSLY